MEEIDLQLKRLDDSGIYYARYVDDIIIVIQGSIDSVKSYALKQNISNILGRYHLQLKRAFIDYKINSNADLLYYRLLNLSRTGYLITVKYQNLYSNYRFIFKYGFNEAYKYVDDFTGLKALDKYIKHCIHYYCNNLSCQQKSSLFSLSYERAFVKRLSNYYYFFNKEEFIERLVKMDTSLQKQQLNRKTIIELKTLYFNLLNFKSLKYNCG